MSDVETISVSVTPDMAEMLRNAVAIGDYASTGDVVREALVEWHRRRADAELGRLWDAGIESGEVSEAAAVFARLHRQVGRAGA